MFKCLKSLYKNLGRLFIRWPGDVELKMRPVVETIKRKDYVKAGIEIAYISIDICSQLENSKISPRHADKYFTYLINFVDLSSVPLEKEVKALILEGNALHNYRSEYGADLKRMRKLANEIIGSEP